MDRSFYLELAASGKRLPVATHLVLHEKPDPEAILLDGARLAAVMIATARRFASPLALPIMDLTLEKDVMLRAMFSRLRDSAAAPALALAEPGRPTLRGWLMELMVATLPLDEARRAADLVGATPARPGIKSWK